MIAEKHCCCGVCSLMVLFACRGRESVMCGVLYVVIVLYVCALYLCAHS